MSGSVFRENLAEKNVLMSLCFHKYPLTISRNGAFVQNELSNR
jgi:hypothetical protein